METAFAKPTRRSLLDHFSVIKDTRQPCKVMYPLPEVLLVVVCATIAGCDDYDEIADWGEARLEFLRRFQPYYWGVPCEDWLQVVMNRIDPDLFAACFTAWANEPRSEAGVALVAIDGKTSRPRRRTGHHRRHRLQSDHRPGHHRGRGRLSAGGQGQPADPAWRDAELLRRRPGGRSRDPHSPRQGPWPYRDAPSCGVGRRRLDVGKPPLSR